MEPERLVYARYEKGIMGSQTMTGASPSDRRGNRVLADKPSFASKRAIRRPSPAQRRYLTQGLDAPGGKLPLFWPDGGEIPSATIRACINNGWAERWFNNPIKPDWLVCRLTSRGRRVVAKSDGR